MHVESNGRAGRGLAALVGVCFFVFWGCDDTPATDAGLDSGPNNTDFDADIRHDAGRDPTPGEDAGRDDDGGSNTEDDAGGADDAGLMTDGGLASEDAGEPSGGEPDASSPPPPTIVINEYCYQHTPIEGSGQRYEYIELFGTPSTDFSDLTLLYVNGNGGASGRIDHAIPVGSTDAMGFWIYEDPDAEADAFSNSSSSLLLVRGFTGAVGDDIDSDNDGTLNDTLPFAEIVDSVAILDASDGDDAYGGVVLTRTFDGLDSNVAAASRIPNGTDTDSISDWVRNDFSGAGLPGGPATASSGEALMTPGAVNAVMP